MLRAALVASLCFALPALAQAGPPQPPPSDLTPDQIKVLGDVVPSGGFAHFSGHGTDACPMPVLHASGYKPWQLTIVATRSIKYEGKADVPGAGANPGPKTAAVYEAFRRALSTCGFPVPEGTTAPLKGVVTQPRKADPAVMKPLNGPATIAYLAGLGQNSHNLPAVFAMRHADKPVLIVVGKAHPMKVFPLPEGWADATAAYDALLDSRGYK